MSTQDNANRLETNESFLHFSIAIAGQSPLIRRICDIFSSEKFKAAMPEVNLAAHLLNEKSDKKFNASCLDKVPKFNNAAKLFAAVPDIRLVLDVSSGGNYEMELRQSAPKGVNLLSPSAALLACKAVENNLLSSGGSSKLAQLRDSFLTMLNQMDEDIFIMDQQGQVLEVNRHFLTRKKGKREDYIGLHCRDIEGTDLCCQGDDFPCPWCGPGRKKNKAKFTGIYNRINQDGTMQYWRVLLFPLPRVAGASPRYIFMRKDITQFASLLQRVQNSEKMAAISELSAFIAHEIRNPLFAIGGFANSLMRSAGLDEQAKQKAQVILEESQRLDDILKSILNFVKPEEHQMADLNVPKILQETVQIMSIGDKELNIETRLNLPQGLPKARANAKLLRQGLINVIKNSQEAMPNGGIIDISAETRGHMIEITVRDNGIGIDPKHMPQIFSPFFSTKEKGAGLGLGMTKRSMEDMGGKLELESEPGKGTTVRFLLLPVLAAKEHQIHLTYRPGQGTSLSVKIPSGI